MTPRRLTPRVLVALLCATALLAPSQRAVGQTLAWKVAQSPVLLLARPVGGATVLASAPVGATLHVIGTSGEWFRVSVTDARGEQTTGWIRAQDLRGATPLTPPTQSAKDTATAKPEPNVAARPASAAPARPAADTPAQQAKAVAAPQVIAPTPPKTLAQVARPPQPRPQPQPLPQAQVTKTPAPPAKAPTQAKASTALPKTPAPQQAKAAAPKPATKASTPTLQARASTTTARPAPRTTAGASAARRPAVTPSTAAASVSSTGQIAVLAPVIPARQLNVPTAYVITAPAPQAFSLSAQQTNIVTPVRPRPTTPNITTARLRRPTLGGPFRLMGIGGLTPQQGQGFAYEGQMSVRVASWLEVVAEGGQFADVMPPSMRTEATAAAAALSEIAGQTVVVDARAPAMFGMTGLRFISSAPKLRPYLTTTAGMAWVNPRVRFVNQGQELTAIAGATFQNKSRDLLFGVAGGVFIPMGKYVAFDLGYRTVRGFDHASSGFSQNQAIFGLGTRF